MALAQLTARRRQAVRIVGIAAVAAVTATYVSGAQAAQNTTTGTETYIVQMAGAPIASYTGDVPGLTATKPAQGQEGRHQVRGRDGVPGPPQARSAATRCGRRACRSRDTIYTYDVALNGFAMKLTAAEATRLRAHERCHAGVEERDRFTADTITTPGVPRAHRRRRRVAAAVRRLEPAPAKG